MLSATEAAQGKALAKFFEHTSAPEVDTGRVLAIRSASREGLRSFDPQRLLCLQTNRVSADRLEHAGLRVCTEVSGQFDLCLVEATRDKDENLYHLAWGWSLLAPSGTLVLSAANALGGESLIKRIKEQGFPIQATYSKAKCRIVRLTRDPGGAALAAPREWLALGEFQEIPDTGLVACPGLFSAHAIDPGTRLLCDALDSPLEGHGADFGAGYGALSRHLLLRSPRIRTLDLYEAEWKGLAAAKLNLSRWEKDVTITYHWSDIAAVVPERRYDWVVMNPPFHLGHAALPALGQRFISAAAGSLRADGTLWMVANRHLPYEAILAERFKDIASLGQTSGYKVYRASNPTKSRSASRIGELRDRVVRRSFE